MKTFSGILIFSFLHCMVQAQRICGSEAYKAQLLQTNASAAQSIYLAEQQLRNTLALEKLYSRRDTMANEIIHIPVVVHVLYNTAAQNISDEQIMSQLTVLNNDFSDQNADRANRPAAFEKVAADIRIQFCLAQVDANNKPTTGIIRKHSNVAVFTADDAVKTNVRGGDNAWDSKKYLNIWVCNLGARTLGYASLPGSPAELDGVVISFEAFGTIGNARSPFNKGRTATHEVGHWLGLKHLWGDVLCGDDEVDDTPRQKSYNYGCPAFPRVTDCSSNADGDMFMNYMDFSDDACMNMFTFQQKKRMRALFATGNARNSFLTAYACDSTLIQAGPVSGDTAAPVPVPVVQEVVCGIYPNPVWDDATIVYKSSAGFVATSFSVYSITGVQLLTGRVLKEKTPVNFSSLAPGMYILKIGEGKNSATKKIVKK